MASTAARSEWEFRDPSTQRSFQVRPGNTDRNYYLTGFIPMARMVDAVTGVGRDEPRIDVLLKAYGPNGLVAAMRDAGLDTEELVWSGAGYGIDSVYLPSLKACREAIAKALAGNVWYSCTRKRSDTAKTVQARSDRVQSQLYWRSRLELSNSARSLPAPFRGCCNMFGPLPEDVQSLIREYLAAPTQAAWLSIRSLVVVGGHRTLWQLWVQRDPSAPSTGNVGFPPAETLERAIRLGVIADAEYCRRQLRSGSRVTH